ncbi:MAG: hypothetical protein JWR16_2206 [Nevskia sp.]|nr:hypothetical protein [Nevskia sp.]
MTTKPLLTFQTLAIGALAFAALACVPAMAQDRGPHGGDDHGQRSDDHGPGGDDHGGDHHAGPSAPHGNYQFRDQDRVRLQQHYQKSFARIDRDHRPRFEAGGSIPSAYRHSIVQPPASVRRGLPPPPRGYRIGYYQGYSVVYDPTTFVILSVLDLLNQ